jgi:hypothetical protein
MMKKFSVKRPAPATAAIRWMSAILLWGLVGATGLTQPIGGRIQFRTLNLDVSERIPSILVTVDRIGGSAGEARVDIATSDSGMSAVAGADYVGTNATLIFSNLVKTLTFRVAILPDQEHEVPESFQLTLSNPMPAGDVELGGNVEATIRILDDDPCVFTLSPSSRLHGPHVAMGSFSFNVATPLGCTWTATAMSDTNQPWLSVVMGQSGNGTGTVAYSFDPNMSSKTRTGRILVGGRTFTVTQYGRDVEAPSIAFLAPAAGRVTSNMLTVTGVSADFIGVDHVEFRLENAEGTNAYQSASGPSNRWTAMVEGLIPGTNVVRARAIDTSGNPSTEITRKFNFVVTSPLAVEVLGSGVVAPPLQQRFGLDVGVNYVMTATAGPRFVFAGWRGGVTSDLRRLEFRMETNLMLQAMFVTNPFTPIKGLYHGLARETTVRHDSSGFLRVSVVDSGAFSASLTLGGRRHAISGAFHPVTGLASNNVTRGTNPPLTVLLTLDLTNGTDQIAGSISDGSFVAGVVCDRAIFHSRTMPAEQQAGRYTLVLPGIEFSPDADDDGGAMPSGPLGDSHAAVTVSLAGGGVLSGALADNTPLVVSTPLAKDGRWPVYVSLYGGKGSLCGWLAFATNDVEDLGGTVHWFKPVLPASRYHTNGFMVEVAASGARWNSTNAPLGMTNGLACFLGGNLLAAFSNNFSFVSATLARGDTSNRFTATLTRLSGLVSGSVRNPDNGRTLPFKGVFHQKAVQGSGFFLGTNSSGLILLKPSAATP